MCSIPNMENGGLTFFLLAIVIHCNHLSYDVVHKVGEFVHYKNQINFWNHKKYIDTF